MKRSSAVTAILAIGVALTTLTGCNVTPPYVPGTQAIVTPASVPTAGTVVGEGAELKCEPTLWPVTLSSSLDSARLLGTDIGYEEKTQEGGQYAVVVSVPGDVVVKAAIIRFRDVKDSAGGTVVAPAPIAVRWPYDPNGVEAKFPSAEFNHSNPIDEVEMCAVLDAAEAK